MGGETPRPELLLCKQLCCAPAASMRAPTVVGAARGGVHPAAGDALHQQLVRHRKVQHLVDRLPLALQHLLQLLGLQEAGFGPCIKGQWEDGGWKQKCVKQEEDRCLAL